MFGVFFYTKTKVCRRFGFVSFRLKIKTDEIIKRQKDSATQQVLTNRHFMLNTTTQYTSSTPKKHQHHDPPRPPASSSSDFKSIVECDRPTSHGGSRSLQHGDAIFKVKLTHSLYYLQLFYRPLCSELSCVLIGHCVI